MAGQRPKGFKLLKAALATRKSATMLAFGFSSGLPFALLIGTLTAWLGEVGVKLATIGIFSPYIHRAGCSRGSARPENFPAPVIQPIIEERIEPCISTQRSNCSPRNSRRTARMLESVFSESGCRFHSRVGTV